MTETNASVAQVPCISLLADLSRELDRWRGAAIKDAPDSTVNRATINAPHQARAVASRPECGCSAFDYRGEFERLRVAAEQAAAAWFQSVAANGVLESAVKLYADILPNTGIDGKAQP